MGRRPRSLRISFTYADRVKARQAVQTMIAVSELVNQEKALTRAPENPTGNSRAIRGNLRHGSAGSGGAFPLYAEPAPDRGLNRVSLLDCEERFSAFSRDVKGSAQASPHD